MALYLHVLDGRMRLNIPVVKRSPQQAHKVQRELQGLNGITEVKANPVTGNVLILFDSRTIGQQPVLEALRQRGYLRTGLPAVAAPMARTGPTNGTSHVAVSLLQAVVFAVTELAVKRVVASVI